MKKVIRDPLHGYIEFDELARALIDTMELQRLRRIHQLGFAYLVYPGANHTRFEHSLGTYHLLCLLLDRLEVPAAEEQELLAAALIHDVGHGPYSHVTEPLLKKYTGKGHEDIETVLFPERAEQDGARRSETITPTIAEILDAFRLDKRAVRGYIKGERAECWTKRDLSRILNGEIDVDKMDYLVRDSYYTGVAYGVVDNTRLIHGLDFVNDELVLTEKGILPAEYLLFSRFLMQPTVYNHHTGRIAQLMFTAALDAVIGAKTDAYDCAAALRRMDDAEITIQLRNADGYPQEMIRRIEARRLFKRAVYTTLSDLDPSVVDTLGDDHEVEALTLELSQRAGVDPRYVLLDVQKPRNEVLAESTAKVVVGHESRSLREVSSLVALLSRELEKRYKIGVYTPDEHRGAVKHAAEAILWP
ncbi:MAG TPA: HD domain-containing protein [Methanomicrobia archaeon]|nr:HD domain-containing protein [Methanomicrobia archaeon]